MTTWLRFPLRQTATIVVPRKEAQARGKFIHRDVERAGDPSEPPLSRLADVESDGLAGLEQTGGLACVHQARTGAFSSASCPRRAADLHGRVVAA